MPVASTRAFPKPGILATLIFAARAPVIGTCGVPFEAAGVPVPVLLPGVPAAEVAAGVLPAELVAAGLPTALVAAGLPTAEVAALVGSVVAGAVVFVGRARVGAVVGAAGFGLQALTSRTSKIAVTVRYFLIVSFSFPSWFNETYNVICIADCLEFHLGRVKQRLENGRGRVEESVPKGLRKE
jgi:hypothetical protein